MGIKKTGVIIILISIIIIFLVIILRNSAIDKNQYVDITLQVILNLGITIMTIGAGTVLYSYFDFVEYIKNELIAIIIEHNYVDRLSVPEKQKLIRRLEKEILYPKGVPSGNLYDFVNKEIYTLVGSPYYEYMSLVVKCYIKKGKIVKEFTRKFKINYEKQEDYIIDLQLMTQCLFKKNKEIKSPFIVDALIINGHNIMDKVEIKDKLFKSSDKYNILFYYDFIKRSDASANNYSNDKTISVDIRYRTIVDFDDKSMGYRVYLPCKNFEAICSYNEKHLEIDAEIFAFRDIKSKGKSLDKGRIDTTSKDGLNIVKISDWILPGDGIMYILHPKKH